MTDRIIFSPSGVKISRNGYDANVASIDNLSMYPGMSSMTMAIDGTVTVAGGARQRFSFTNSTGRMPYIIVNSTDGVPPDRETYCAMTEPPYNWVDIRNDVQVGAPARTIRFTVLIDNAFV